MLTYVVVILQDGEYARLECETLEEAHLVRRSFVNYGKCQRVTIEKKN
jgi:hypothetical protein